MVKYVNRSISILEIGGKPLSPNDTMDLTAEQVKEPGVDWLIRSQFLIKEADDTGPRSTVPFIPTANPENGAVVLEEPGTSAPEQPPAKQPATRTAG